MQHSETEKVEESEEKLTMMLVQAQKVQHSIEKQEIEKSNCSGAQFTVFMRQNLNLGRRQQDPQLYSRQESVHKKVA